MVCRASPRGGREPKSSEGEGVEASRGGYGTGLALADVASGEGASGVEAKAKSVMAITI